MRTFRLPMIWVALALLCSCVPAHAVVYQVRGQVPTMYIGLSTDTKPIQGQWPGNRFMESDTNNVFTWKDSDAPGTAASWVENYYAVTLGTLLSGEDQTNSLFKVEQQFSYKAAAADAQAKASAGFVHSVTCATTAGAAATAGALTIRDALTETTPIAATIGMPATAFVPFTVILDAVMTTGIYIGFDGTLAGVSCTVSFR